MLKFSEAQKNDLLYAGGKQYGSTIKVRINKKVNNSYLTQLWNKEVFNKNQKTHNISKLSNLVSKYFTIAILFISLFTAIFWIINDIQLLWNSVTSVLIVACPCALALSIPFTYGSILRHLGKQGIYLKNDTIIETISMITDIVFDKTGTITQANKMDVEFKGRLTSEEEQLIKSLVTNSTHPLSIAINEFFSKIEILSISNFKEVIGFGLYGEYKDFKIKIGSSEFTGITHNNQHLTTQVYITFNNVLAGEFLFKQHYRNGLQEVVKMLQKKHTVHLVSGDNNKEKDVIINNYNIHRCIFDQSPEDKLNYINEIQEKGNTTLMVGDGLNDAGALKQSDIGIAISENIHHFTPACDVILESKQFNKISDIIKLCTNGIYIVKLSFIISFIYNIIGLYYAVSGLLSPITAAILMPLSSITIVLFTTITSNIISKKALAVDKQQYEY